MPRLLITLAVTCILTATAGCSDSGTDAGSIGHSIGENVTEFAQGVGSGVDNQLKVDIQLSEELTATGLTHTVAKQQTSLNQPDKSISIYFLASQPLEAQLVAKAFNSDDQEIGRASAEVQFQTDDAQYVSFTFPPEMDRQTVVKYTIDSRNIHGESSAAE